MDLLKIKTKKRMIGAAVLLSAALFTSSAAAQDHMMGSGGSGGSGSEAGTVTVQDINFDQILDIITTGGPGNKLNVFLGNGDGSFNQIFQAGLGLGVSAGLIDAADVPEIAFYQSMMTLHLAGTCCPDDAAAGDGSGGGSTGGLQIPGAAAAFCGPGIPQEFLDILSAGGDC
ncbi:MAG: VCBS repeat-containing protein [Gammaproteobacteria bacterium]|nr:VCBS repeat-containing protein [Gammaproteobacteria bacterium]MCF6260137.1 VCBS repeat-containing protein [Gammaproteobacteria bacterium]